MENNQYDEQYHFIPQIQLNGNQNQNIELQREENIDSWSYCLLITCGMSALMGGYFLSGMTSYKENQPDECMIIIRTIKYYSQYLIIDGAAQIIVIFIISCCLRPFKKYNIRKQVDKQLLFQFFDQLLIFIVIIIIETIIKDKKRCITIGTNLLIILYMVLVYILTFLLSVQVWNL
ncbi:unnamed protein product [Paramecium primaurelia]|uniref:Transmembrane protein n=1 Tax=Paramecium primaurelia TaxID=5886 RepID=A0A8S1LY45_PARPR|nr:unnamed protein product [Paramecium primaurelia]